MRIVDFRSDYLEDAKRLALRDYKMQRVRTPELPDMTEIPDLKPLLENGLGVAACEGDKLAGYLLCCGPFPRAFHSTDAVGVWSPIHANAAIPEGRAAIYARLYQAAAEKWVRAGASSHGIGLYTWDEEVQSLFFRYGFGMRTADAIRGMDDLNVPDLKGYTVRRLTREDLLLAFPLERMLDVHMAKSPTFMRRPSDAKETFLKNAARAETRLYAAFHDGRTIAYLRTEKSGETFIGERSDYIHITGAYCLPNHRGKSIVQMLMNCAICELKRAGYAHFGVDFESINPGAHRFWQKYFGVYTCGVVRRIDEHACAL